MPEIVLFHSVLGLRPGVHAFADDLRAAGHLVHTPDLWDGEVFDNVADGIAKRDALGIPQIIARAATAVADLPAALVYAGFSLGVVPAQFLAQTRPGARAALLLHSAVPAAAFEVPWPAGVPLQIHTMDQDERGDLEEARALVEDARAAGSPAELHTYPGKAHLFTDPDLPDYDPSATAVLRDRVEDFLADASG
jgi:dienelactone hydrolase